MNIFLMSSGSVTHSLDYAMALTALKVSSDENLQIRVAIYSLGGGLSSINWEKWINVKLNNSSAKQVPTRVSRKNPS